GAAVAALADRAQLIGADRTIDTEVTVDPREVATVTIAGRRLAAAAKTPSEDVPALQASTGALTVVDAPSPPAPASTGDAAPAPMAPATTADGRFALSSKGNTIKVWDLRTGQAIHTFQGQGAAVQPAPAPPRAETATPAKHGGGKRPWVLIAAGAALLGAA